MKPTSFTGIRDYQDSLLQAFLDQEALMLYSRDHHLRLLHAWRHPRGFLAGSRDASLSVWNDTVTRLQQQKFYVLVRPFGGLSIPVDLGVLNLTLILPEEPSLDDAFEELANWLAHSLTPFGHVTIGEVSGSYCPGRYDLSLKGSKIAGIAQRRAKGVVAVSAFINLFPSDYSRSGLVEAMYHAENVRYSSSFPSWIPQIHPSSMGDLLTITDDERWIDPHFLLSLLHAVHPLHDTGVSLNEMLSPHMDEATSRLKLKRNLNEWTPFN